MSTHPLIVRVAVDIGKFYEDDRWQVYVPEAIRAIQSIAEWTQELHHSAKADLDSTDCYITVPYLLSVSDEAYAGEHTDS
jgi:hypothetical protein